MDCKQHGNADEDFFKSQVNVLEMRNIAFLEKSCHAKAANNQGCYRKQKLTRRLDKLELKFYFSLTEIDEKDS